MELIAADGRRLGKEIPGSYDDEFCIYEKGARKARDDDGQRTRQLH